MSDATMTNQYPKQQQR